MPGPSEARHRRRGRGYDLQTGGGEEKGFVGPRDPKRGIRRLVEGSDTVRVQELCESRGSRPELPVLMSLFVSVDVKQH